MSELGMRLILIVKFFFLSLDWMEVHVRIF